MSLTLEAAADSELTIQKSRFLGRVEPVADRREAQARVAARWAGHPGASHVCWALLAGGQSAAVDDGEPGGTAGRPMLEVLRHHELDGVLASVVRYYGGIKLGAGGLVRAYTDAVVQALATARKVPRRRWSAWRCALPYALEGAVRRQLAGAGARGLQVEHGPEAVTMAFELPEDEAPALRQRLLDLGQGRLQMDAPPA